MAVDLEKILLEISSFAPSTMSEVESFRIKHLGKKGVVKELSAQIKDIEPSERKSFGQDLNKLKQAVEDKIEEFDLQST